MFDTNSMEGEVKLRDRIIATAIDIGTQNGASGLTMRALARSLGVGATTLYQQFDSKAAILQEIWHFGHRQMARHLEPALQYENSYEALTQVGLLYVDFGRKQPWLYEVIMGRECPDLSDMPDEQYFDGISGYASIARIIERGIQKGEVSPEIDSSTAILRNWAALHGITSIIMDGRFDRRSSRRLLHNEGEFIRIYIESIVSSLLDPKNYGSGRAGAAVGHQSWYTA